MRRSGERSPTPCARWCHRRDAKPCDASCPACPFLTTTSNEPFYAQRNLDPSVTLHVREVVLPGRERTVGQDGKVLLLIHGYSVPGYVAFDTDHGNCSLMRYFARAGWDTFTLDLEGFGLSTRPSVMDTPAAFPDSKAPIRTDVTLHDVERVVDLSAGYEASSRSTCSAGHRAPRWKRRSTRFSIRRG
jgi:alpha-beta hydrolase superfamily lysophospholipase